MYESRTYYIHHTSGITNRADATTLTGAKREASGQMTFGGGSVTVEERETGRFFRRCFWHDLNCFGWESWTEIERQEEVR